MSRRYTYTTGLNRGGDEPTWEGDVKVSFSVLPGEAETGPTYACGGTPASDAQVEDIRLETVDGKARPWGMYGGNIADEDNVFEQEVIEELENSEVHLAAMLAEAAEVESAERDAALEARRDG